MEGDLLPPRPYAERLKGELGFIKHLVFSMVEMVLRVQVLFQQAEHVSQLSLGFPTQAAPPRYLSAKPSLAQMAPSKQLVVPII